MKSVVVNFVKAMHTEAFEIVLRPDTGWRSLDLAGLWQYRDLLSLLVRRDFVSKYKQTILGPLWFIIQPLMITVVFSYLFGRMAKFGAVTPDLWMINASKEPVSAGPLLRATEAALGTRK